MYSIDGVPLQNPTYSWRLKRSSNPRAPRSVVLTDFNTSGRDGTIQARGFVATPTITLVITTPEVYLDDLYQLLRLGASLTKTSTPTIAAACELVSLSTNVVALTAGGIYEVTATLRLPEVYWRGTATITYGPTTITANNQQVTVFTASEGPIRDALICVAGSITGLSVQASNGTFFTYTPNIPAGTFLTFDSVTGRAWTGTSAYALTTEVTGNIQNGPGPYFLELVGSSNPAVAGTALTVTYTAISGTPSIQARARESYDY